MLKLKYLFENFQLAKCCLQHWDHDEDTVDEMLRRFRISSNAVYPFRQEGRLCFLRLAPAEEKSVEEIIGEVEVILWLRSQGFPAMEPVPMKNGKYVDIIESQWGRYIASCFYGVPGVSLEKCDADMQVIAGYGECLGKLHRALKSCPLARRRNNHLALLETIRFNLETYSAPVYIFNELEAICNQLAMLPITDNNYGLVHYDFEPDNVFFDAESNSFSVIDFDDMIQCWYMLDVVRALDALVDVTDEAHLVDAETAFLTGYRSASTLTEEDEQTLPLMRRLVRIHEYGGLLRCLSDNIEAEPDWLIKLRKKLTDRVRSYESRVAADRNSALSRGGAHESIL